jgi:GH25 family lysozyme M1 (1,4-beta-N-acetylmuramidase)
MGWPLGRPTWLQRGASCGSDRGGPRQLRSFLVSVRLLLPALVLSPLAAACGGPETLGGSGPCTAGLRGIDVSTFNGAIDWGAVADGGIAFAFAKASEGLTICDDRFSDNWNEMGANGLARGAYHFFRPGDDGSRQADAFLACVGDLGAGDLPPVLDWETSDASQGSEAIASAQAFIAEIRARTGLPTVIYTDRDYWEALDDPAQFETSSLWLASYSADCPVVPLPWSSWLFWQNTDEGAVAGVDGPVDLDSFDGTLAELRAFAGLDTGDPDLGLSDAGAPRLGAVPTEARTGCGVEGGPGCAALWCWLFVAGRRKHESA